MSHNGWTCAVTMNDAPPIPPPKISVQRDGDDQLWLASEKLDDGFQWTLPVICKPFVTVSENPDHTPENYFFIFGANYSWSPRQYAELCYLLDRHDCVPGDQRGWWYKESVLKKFAVKAPGITPEFYVRWPGYEIPTYSADFETLELPEEPGFNKDELKFLNHLQRMTSTQSWEALKFLWIQFRKQAILWMSVERRPLDLGFIRLVPTPYRANWKEAMAVRFGGLLHLFRSINREDRQETLQEAGFFKALSSVKLLAVDREKPFCHWSVEALPSQDLEKAIEEHEYQRFQRIGPAGYARHILRSMANGLGDTMRIFGHYARAVCTLPGKRVEGERGFGVEIIVPELRGGSVRAGRGIVEVLELSPNAFETLSDVQEPQEQGQEPKPMTVKVPKFLRNVAPYRELPEKIDGNGVK